MSDLEAAPRRICWRGQACNAGKPKSPRSDRSSARARRHFQLSELNGGRSDGVCSSRLFPRRVLALTGSTHLRLRDDDREDQPPAGSGTLSSTNRSVFAASLIATTAGWVSLRSTEMADRKSTRLNSSH